jgi:hypothetical protein
MNPSDHMLIYKLKKIQVDHILIYELKKYKQ